MSEHPRYRVEDGFHCVDIRVQTVEQLFDNRDPAPFRERDLDPDLVEYLVAATEDLATYGPFRIVVWFPGPCDDITPAFRAHFEYELQRLDRRRRRERRVGGVALVIAITLLVVLLSIAPFVEQLPGGTVAHEGLVIFSWVVLWRPVEALVYEWIPAARQRKLLRRLHTAPIAVRTGTPPETTGSPLVRPAPTSSR